MASSGDDARLPWCSTARTAVEELAALDHQVFAAIAETPTPTIDASLRRLSNAASYSRLWLGVGVTVAVFGGKGGRKAALVGGIAIAVTSATVNLGVKRLAPRSRPDRRAEEVPQRRRVQMPDSTSFPSGHSASAFAFAAAATASMPVLAAPLYTLAAAVAYSRVHTGVHYPGDVIVGSLIGAVMGRTTFALVGRWIN